MNKKFLKKMIKAEKYKYEALKEILPNDLRKNLEEFEKDALNLLKDVVFEMMKDDVEKKESKGSIKRVDIDFTK
ncbi:hypothetical protein CACET_c12750 [Clostridium aceticum]|uniref:Uncharacterized protein n=1 Tax=Clostridium aceticum TaxID=84022 RepID=A0A0D8IEQ9_9CLOT|nr:hypothetical protein [Clostridium aceticum]AKL94740.1 hypothetical protein CACET_c12750 [Clostridium aceticum]KJF27691.1 hypothetical protein TZ02_03505 [Clostridium aceticum]